MKININRISIALNEINLLNICTLAKVTICASSPHFLIVCQEVRLFVLQVSNSFIPEFMTNVSHLLLPHLFQRALLENKSESLDLVENIWSQVCELCPLQRLLLAGCPVYGSWFALIQQPSNHPLPGKDVHTDFPTN